MVDWTKPIWIEGKPEVEWHFIGFSKDGEQAFIEAVGYSVIFFVSAETGQFIGTSRSSALDRILFGCITNKPETEPEPPAWPGVRDWSKPLIQRCGLRAKFLGRDDEGVIWVGYQQCNGVWEAHVVHQDGRWNDGGPDHRDLRNAEPGELEGSGNA